MLDGLKVEDSIAGFCRPTVRQSIRSIDERGEFIAQSLYFRWSKEFLEAEKKCLAGDTACAATSTEVKDLRRDSCDLKEVVAAQALELRLLKNA